MRGNGGIIGKKVTITNITASAVFDTLTQYGQIRSSTWPLSAGAGIVESNLVLNLDSRNTNSYGGSGSTWTDLSDEGNNGTISGATFDTGPGIGLGYAVFDGSGDAINVTHNNTLTGDFTVECWVYLNTTGIMMVGSSGYDYNTQWMRFNENTTGNISMYYDAASGGTAGAYVFQNVAGGITANTWHHVATCRSGTDTRLFVDGDLKATNTSFTGSPRFDKIGALYVGGSLFTGDPNYFNGRISNVRVLDGTALYTSNFNPPLVELTNISNTSLLTCQGSSIVDASDNSSTISLVGNTFGSIGVQNFDFDGSSDHVRMDSDMFNPNSDFTVSSWVNADVTATQTIVSDHLSSGTIQIRFVNDNTVQIVDNYVVNVGTFSNFTYSTGTWYNVVVTRSSNTYTLYVNGSYKSDFTSTNSYSYGAQTIGANNNGNERWNGKISQIACYSRAINSTEVTQNWNALKSSYGY